MKKIKRCDHAARKLYATLTRNYKDIPSWKQQDEDIKDIYRSEIRRQKAMKNKEK